MLVHVMGFAWWVPKMVLKGCYLKNYEVAYGSEEITKKKAMAVENLEFKLCCDWGMDFRSKGKEEGERSV